MSEKEQLKLLARALNLIVGKLKRPETALKNHVRKLLKKINKGKTPTEAELKKLERLFNNVDATFAKHFAPAARQAYRTVRRETRKFLLRKAIKKTRDIDEKTVNVLIRDTKAVYSRSIKRSRAAAVTFFRNFNKTGTVKDSEINKLLAQGLIEEQDARASEALLRELLRKKKPKPKDLNALKQFRKTKLAEFRRALQRNTNLNVGLRKALLENKRRALEDDKLIQVIDKNGDIRNYEVKTYSETVTRTRIGDAQVKGMKDQSREFGIVNFRISAHNTKTPICIPHENKVYTIERKGPNADKYEYLSPENEPTYHANCIHRMFPELDD